MEYSSISRYPVSYQGQPTPSRAGYSYGYGAPQMFDGSIYQVDPGYTQFRSNSDLPASQNASIEYATGSSHGGPPSPKRARRDEVQHSWLPGPSDSVANRNANTNSYAGGYKGLDLPPNPIQRQSGYVTSNHREERAQTGSAAGALSAHQDQILDHQEQQIRALAEYNNASNLHNIGPRFSPHSAHNESSTAQWQGQANIEQSLLPQRGAKGGNVLKLSCDPCQRRKRKCTKEYPCAECQSAGDECVPRVRKKRRNSLSTTPLAEEPVREELEAGAEPNEASTSKTKKRHLDGIPSRTFVLNLPPVVGDYQEWSNKRLKYNPFPESIDSIREKLFKLEKPILLNSQQFADYWPHMSNIYTRSVRPRFEANGSQVEVWECRNYRRQASHRRAVGKAGEGKRKQIRNREGKARLLETQELCKIRFRIVTYFKHADTEEDHKLGLGNCRCAPEWMYLARMEKSMDLEHNHALESLDKYTRSDAVLSFARLKVEEGGYLYATVKRWMQDKYRDKTNQLAFLSSQDVANAARKWRVRNPYLELIETVDKPSPEEERRKRCLNLLSTATHDGLRKALIELWSWIPAAAEMALPIIEAAQEADTHSGPENEKILEGEDIVVPVPGLPRREKYRWNELNATNDDTRHSSYPGKHLDSSQPHSTPSTTVLVQPPSSVALPYQSYCPVPGNHFAAHTVAPPPMIQHQIASQQPQVQFPPIGHGERPLAFPGAYTVNTSGHRYAVPTESSMIAQQIQSQGLTHGLARPIRDQRPSWANPNTNDSNKATENTREVAPNRAEIDEAEVNRQLEAELQEHG